MTHKIDHKLSGRWPNPMPTGHSVTLFLIGPLLTCLSCVFSKYIDGFCYLKLFHVSKVGWLNSTRCQGVAMPSGKAKYVVNLSEQVMTGGGNGICVGWSAFLEYYTPNLQNNYKKSAPNFFWGTWRSWRRTDNAWPLRHRHHYSNTPYV